MRGPMVSSRRAAALIGVATHTLACWRAEGKGPDGWVRINRTLVVYPLEAIESFLRQKAALPNEPFFPPRPQAESV